MKKWESKIMNQTRHFLLCASNTESVKRLILSSTWIKVLEMLRGSKQHVKFKYSMFTVNQLENHLASSVKPSDSHDHGSSLLSRSKGNSFRNDSKRPADRPALPHLLPSKAPRTNTSASPLLKLPSNGDSLQGQTQRRAPTNAPEKPHNPAGNFHPITSLFYFL